MDGEPILHLALVAAWRGDHAEASRLVTEAEQLATDDPQDVAAARTYELLIARALGRPNPAFVTDDRAAPRRGGGRVRLAVRQPAVPVACGHGRGAGGR